MSEAILKAAVPFAHIIPDGDLDGIIVRLFKAREALERICDDETAEMPNYVRESVSGAANAVKGIARDLDQLQSKSDAVHLGWGNVEEAAR